jgi:hypothetical protein
MVMGMISDAVAFTFYLFKYIGMFAYIVANAKESSLCIVLI